MYDSSNKLIIVVLAVLLMAGSIGLYMMSLMLSDMNPDVRELPHEYDAVGTLDNTICFGEGSTTFIPESEVQHVYSVKYTVSNSSVSYSDSFTIIFDADNRPVENVYSYIGKDKVFDVDVTVWSYDYKGSHIEFYVGEKCLIYLFDIVSDKVDITLTISDIDL